MSSDADPRRSWGFRRRVALARAAGGFETIWSAAWPSLMVVGAFLVVSLLGLWATLPAWLHGLGLVLFVAALGWTTWRARHALRWPNHTAGLRRLEQVNRLPHQPLRLLGDRLSGGAQDPATQVLWRRHLDRLRQAVRGLRVGPPRSDLPRRDPWALRVAIVLLLVVALVEAGNMAPKRLVQAFELERGAQDALLPLETMVWVTPPAYTDRRSGWSWPRPRSAPKRSRSRWSSPCRVAARCWRSSIISGARPTASPWPSARSGRSSARSARTAPRPP
jgi:hypothetical protein